jgi:perosamine synthetase
MIGAARQTGLPERVLRAIQAVVGTAPATLHEPSFEGNEWRYVKACLDSTLVSSAGPFVDRFETDLASFTGAGFAVAVTSGTAALHMALHLAGVVPGDEVLVPALTFVATANAVTYCGAVPHLVDSEERTFGIDAAALHTYLNEIAELRDGRCINRRTGRVIRAVVPMHVFGHPADITAIVAVASAFNLIVVEDAAESLGSTVGARHTGTFGAMGTISFNGNKTVTTGGGGAIITNDRELARRAKHLTTTAKLPHRWELRHDEVGYNYRMPNINAAIGCAQLEQLPGFLRAKRLLFERYRAAFETIDGGRILSEPGNCRSNFWLQTLVLDEAAAGYRDAILAAGHDAGILLRPSWVPLHRQRPFAACPRMDLMVADSLATRIINLPSSPKLLAAGTEVFEWIAEAGK